MPKKAQTPAATLVLDGDLDVFSIHGQWERFRPLLAATGGEVVLDLSGLGDLDMSGVQLLHALDRDLRGQGASLVLRGAQAGWKDRFGPLGLGDIFSGADA